MIEKNKEARLIMLSVDSTSNHSIDINDIWEIFLKNYSYWKPFHMNVICIARIALICARNTFH